MNFLTEHGIGSYEELESKVAAVSVCRDTAHAEIKRIKNRAAELSLVMKHAATYRQLKPLYDRYCKSGDKEKFLRGHESEIILFEAAARELKRLGAVPLPTTESMKKDLPISEQKRNGSLRSTKPQEPKPRNTIPSSRMWMRCWPFQRNRNNSDGMNLNKFL